MLLLYFVKKKLAIFWFRRDLRLDDNAGLYHALRGDDPVLPLFIFDRNILDPLENRADRRVEFIYAALSEMHRQLKEQGASLEVHYGFPAAVFRHLITEYHITGVYTNTDYEPYATERDGAVQQLLKEEGIPFRSYKDQVIFEKGEVLKDDGKPYTVFTPYSRKWKAMLNDFYLASYPVKKYRGNFLQQRHKAMPALGSMGFKKTGESFPSAVVRQELLRNYEKRRDFPGVKGTSGMGVHLRMGTVSIRMMARKAMELSDTYLGELIWREFYQMILWHFPAMGQGRSFRPAYDHIRWRNNEQEFGRWCSGQTGYPLVDAGMRELNATGFMHNRVRMVTASFLAKHLLIDWRWGEAYFAEKLLDFELASNNGNWQWAAGCGCDAAPYFRVFNPSLQAKRFDPDRSYIRRWVPEWEGLSYPAPMVDHEEARKRALAVYSKAVKER